MSFAAPPPDATRREEPLAGHTRHEQHPPAPDWSEQTRPEALPPEQQTAGHTRREELPDQDLSGRTRREELPSEALDGRTRREELPGEAADGRTRREELPDQYLDGRTRREGPEAGGGRPGPLAADGAGRHTRRLVLPEPLAERYEYIGDLAAGGAEADLALLRDKTTGRELVMKLYRAAHAGVDMKALEALSRADREHVVELVEIREWQGLTWELQEFFPLGTLEDLRRKHGPKLNEAQVEVIVEQLASAIEHVHSLGIAHRDLKPANVLVRSEQPRLDLALADFGLSVAQALSFDVRSVAGTWGWAAPEVHHGIAGRAGDWWALGAIVYEMTVGRTLFTRADGTVLPEAQIRALVGEGKYSTEAVESDRLRLLVDGLLTYNREQRWGAAQVNEWLAGGSPAVVRSAPAVGLPLLGTVVHDPRDLAAALRERWQEAGDLMASRPDQALRAWLAQTPQGRDALAVIEFGGSPGAKLVRLQGVLDPSVAAEFRGVPLTADNFAEQIAAVRGAHDSPDQAAAAEWLDAVRRERILGAWAAVSGSAESAAADYHLAQWFERAKEVAANWPAPIRESLFRVQSPITANALAAALTGSTETVVQAAREQAEGYRGAIEWARTLAEQVKQADPSDVGLFLAAAPVLAVQSAEDARVASLYASQAEANKQGHRSALLRRSLPVRVALVAAYVAAAALMRPLAAAGTEQTAAVTWAIAWVMPGALAAAALSLLLSWFIPPDRLHRPLATAGSCLAVLATAPPALTAVLPADRLMKQFAEAWQGTGLWLGLAPLAAVAGAGLGSLASRLLSRAPTKPRPVATINPAPAPRPASRTVTYGAAVVTACSIGINLAFLATPPARALAAAAGESRLPSWAVSIWQALMEPTTASAGFPWPPLGLGLLSGIALLCLTGGLELLTGARRGALLPLAAGWAAALVLGIHAVATAVVVSTWPGRSAVPDSLWVCLGTLAACGVATAFLQTRSTPHDNS